MPDPHESSPAARLGRLLKEKGLYCATAESCTGGLIGAALPDIPGSSAWYRGGVISYANEAKIRLLGVSGAILATRGAVSEEVAVAMAQGACGTLGADVAMASTGIAGPGGGSPLKPVGTVWLAWVVHGSAHAKLFHFSGDRAAIRSQAVEAAISGLLNLLVDEA